jgi:hypothetical protein
MPTVRDAVVRLLADLGETLRSSTCIRRPASDTRDYVFRVDLCAGGCGRCLSEGEAQTSGMVMFCRQTD